MNRLLPLVTVAAISLSLAASPAFAHKLRESGETVKVAKSDIRVTPSRDWNRLNGRRGKRTERWTLDGEQLNDVTFFGGIEPGDSLFKDRGRNLPTLQKNALLVDVPDLLNSTYRIVRGTRSFDITSVEPAKFLGSDGVRFEYKLVDDDQLTRLGEGHATLIDGQLFMTTFEAPRLHYFEQTLPEFRKLVESAQLK